MGCCLIGCLGALWPRVTLVLIWIFARVIPEQAFTTSLWPLLGFFFLPTTTLAYELCRYYLHGVDNPWSLVILALAFLHDIGHLGAGARGARG